MKNLVLAALIAVASALSYGVPAEAATVTTYRGHHHARSHCYTKTVKHYRHGRVWYEKVRVCR